MIRGAWWIVNNQRCNNSLAKMPLGKLCFINHRRFIAVIAQRVFTNWDQASTSQRSAQQGNKHSTAQKFRNQDLWTGDKRYSNIKMFLSTVTYNMSFFIKKTHVTNRSYLEKILPEMIFFLNLGLTSPYCGIYIKEILFNFQAKGVAVHFFLIFL